MYACISVFVCVCAGEADWLEWLASDALGPFCLCFPSAQITDIFTVSGFFVVNFS